MNEPEQPILRIMDAYQSAVFAKDVGAFAALYDRSVRIFDPWARWSYDGAEAWREMATGWFGSLGTDRVVVTWADVRTTITNEIAVLHAFFTYQAVSPEGTELRAMSNRLTWVLKPTDGAWKIIHEHTSAPVDLATGKVILKR